MNNWQDILSKQPIFFVSPDIKWGMGLEDLLPHFSLICSYYDPLIPILRKKNIRIFCLEEVEDNKKPVKNTGSLLENASVEEYIRKNSPNKPFIAYFKPSLKIDYLILDRNYRQIGNSYKLNNQFENKIALTQLNQIGLSSNLLPGLIGDFGDFEYSAVVKKFHAPFVVQFGHGWAGKTTFSISNENAFKSLQNQYPKSKIRICPQIDGFTILNNCSIYRDNVFVSPPAIQINGIKELSPKKFVTCGRQWPANILTKKMTEEIEYISANIGQLMKRNGFKGFFGIDFLVETKSGRIYITEINARLTASTAFFTRLERGAKLIPLLEYHYGAFLNSELPIKRGEMPISGSQVIIREKKTVASLKLKDFGVYEIDQNKIKYIHDNYQPENLTERQFIWHMEKNPKVNVEIARIESIMPALSAPSKLSPWLDNLLSGKMV